MTTVQDNLKVTVKELDGAKFEQKKRLKKYLFLGLIVLVLLLIVGGLIAWWRIEVNRNREKNKDDNNDDEKNVVNTTMSLLIKLINV